MTLPHTFWNQKPLRVHPEATLSLIQEYHGFQPEALPFSLEWDVFHLEDTDKCEEWYAFLIENYKDHKNPFQIVYTRSHLQFEMSSGERHWIVALRSAKRPGRPMVACIAGVVRQLCHTFTDSTPDALNHTLFIEFLCIHSSLRHLGIAPKLIHEISRLAHISPLKIQKAYYSSATHLPEAFCCSYNHHRPIQWERCLEMGYISESKHRLTRSRSRRLPTEYCFQRVTHAQSPECVLRICEMINTYNARHRKVYEPMTPDHWVKMCQTDCVDCIMVCDARSTNSDIIGCIATISHPYQITMGNKGGRLNTVLLYHYGFDLNLSSQQMLSIWNALFTFAESEFPHWDAFTTVHPDVYRAIGFQKGHAYYHYMYNVHMKPLESTDITMIGI